MLTDAEEISATDFLTIEGFERFAEQVLGDIRESINELEDMSPESYLIAFKNPDTGKVEKEPLEIIIDCDDAFETNDSREKFTLAMTECCRESWAIGSLIIFEGWYGAETAADTMAVPQVMSMSAEGNIKVKEQKMPINSDSALVCILEHVGYPHGKSKLWVCKLSTNKDGDIIVAQPDKKFGYCQLEGHLTNLLPKEVKAQA